MATSNDFDGLSNQMVWNLAIETINELHQQAGHKPKISSEKFSEIITMQEFNNSDSKCPLCDKQLNDICAAFTFCCKERYYHYRCLLNHFIDNGRKCALHNTSEKY